MYVVKYKDQIVLSTELWDSTHIVSWMKMNHELVISLPFDKPDDSDFPLVVNEDCMIFPVEVDRPAEVTNPLVHYYYGPLWEILPNKVVAHYELHNLELHVVKGNYKGKAAYLRYQKEIAGIKVTIDGKEYQIDTNRESRSIFFRQLVTMSDTDVINWKFSNENWVQLTKQNLQLIVDSIDAHVQSAFNEEYALSLEIDSKQSVEELVSMTSLNKPNDLEDSELNFKLFAAHLL